MIKSGGVIVYPTDTFYGLGVDPRNASAVRRIFAIKGRSADQPILLLIHDRHQVREWAAEVTPRADSLMRRYWPGPLTLVFQARKDVLPELTAGTGMIGLRVPGNAITRLMLEFFGTAITGTSANIAGAPSLRSALEAADSLGSSVDLILDGGETSGGLPSTVFNVVTGGVIRRGAVEVEE